MGVDEVQPLDNGWQSNVVYRVIDGCSATMTNVAYNEVFTAWQQFNGSNWTAPLAAYGWASTTFDDDTQTWTLVDNLWESPRVNYTPTPFPTGNNGYDEARRR